MTPGDPPPPAEEPLDEELDSSKSNNTEKWELTKQALDKLLEQFSSDPKEAASKYNLMQAKLIRYFEWWSTPSPEREAWTTINRVARRLDEGTQINNLTAYFHSTAYNVRRETWNKPRPEPLPDDFDKKDDPPPVDVLKEDRMRCLDECLEKLSDENRRLIEEYYADEKQAKIRHRKQLAEGSNLNALRIRVCRIKKGLEECVKDCMKSVEARNRTDFNSL